MRVQLGADCSGEYKAGLRPQFACVITVLLLLLQTLLQGIYGLPWYFQAARATR